MLSLNVAYIRTMAPKAQKSPKDQKKGKKKAKQPLLGRTVFLFRGFFFYWVISCYVCYLVLLHVAVYYGVYTLAISIK